MSSPDHLSRLATILNTQYPYRRNAANRNMTPSLFADVVSCMGVSSSSSGPRVNKDEDSEDNPIAAPGSEGKSPSTPSSFEIETGETSVVPRIDPTVELGPPSFDPNDAIGGMLSLNIGSEGTSFSVYKETLCRKSLYFKNLIEGPFQEAGSDFFYLGDVSPSTMKSFSQWLYTGRVNQSLVNDTYRILDLALFADFYDIVDLRTACDRMIHRALYLKYRTITNSPSLHLIKTAWAKLPMSSPICKMLVDSFAQSYGNHRWTAQDPRVEEMPPSFLVAVLDVMVQLRRGKEPEHKPFQRVCRPITDFIVDGVLLEFDSDGGQTQDPTTPTLALARRIRSPRTSRVAEYGRKH